jgi:Domain of unknown function (DUF1902)
MNAIRLPLGFPGWKLWARAGLPVSIAIEVIRDSEAGVYVAVGQNIQGLVVEAESLDQIKVEVELLLSDILRDNHSALPVSTPHQARLNFSTPLAA